jgi:hypothetical protein
MYLPEHNNLHESFDAPTVPSDIIMQDVLEEYIAINGVLNVVREHKTNETYQISPTEWGRIRNGVQSVHTAGNSLSYI